MTTSPTLYDRKKGCFRGTLLVSFTAGNLSLSLPQNFLSAVVSLRFFDALVSYRLIVKDKVVVVDQVAYLVAKQFSIGGSEALHED